MTSESPELAPSAQQIYINPETGLPRISRFTDYNIEERTIAAKALYLEGFYPSMRAAAQAWKVNYKRLRSRINGHHPVRDNGGNRTLFSKEEEKAILAWCWRRVTQGHHIQQRTLRQYANSLLKATHREPHASRFWARRFLRRYREVFHRRKSRTLAANRKAMADRANVEEWFAKWTEFFEGNDINFDNVWNFDETGFIIGYLMNGIMIWTFLDIDSPLLTDAHTTISMTIVESISATGGIIAPFVIMPGVQIPSRWVDNDLDEQATIVTTPKGYIDNITAQDFFDHFERLTRPQNTSDLRVILYDGCESHFTKELYQKALDANIILYPFPPHLTHILQPLDVGLFSTYKHWHQEALLREIADGATDFNKADFMFHLQEIRRKATKKSTIISSWAKSGIYPLDPSVVINKMVNPLSSLSLEVAERDLPGYITPGLSSNHSSDFRDDSNEEEVGESSRDIHQNTHRNEGIPMMPSTPPTVIWNNVNTPQLNLRQIKQYEGYVALRIESSISSGVPLTPSVLHVNEKVRKAHTTLALNGITATQEMRRLKEKSLRRSERDEGTIIIANYGPITVYDARLRVAKDQHNRRANQDAELRRYYAKEVRDEAVYLRRWLFSVRKLLRSSLKEYHPIEQHRSQPSYSQEVRPFTVSEFFIKTQSELCIKSTELLATRYCAHREMHAKMKESKLLAKQARDAQQEHIPKIFPFYWNPPFLLPFDYNINIVKDAVDLIASPSRKQRGKQKALSVDDDELDIDESEDNEEIEEEEEEEEEEDDDDISVKDTIEVR
ncbi:hypothetical protein HZS61_002232 [Fusarium oxysporum f. sp. conglutinans]|uniref:HTH CENPB-type domain-containing protein n=1 Tax=Fusarium oxysporum f. sp. conglutinans TaxID=100902 RepID=A0A8H6GHE9_FUSOX|nr:hypothetical protein HZS61_002232 [Fusarium oxysporum f. sp. conglutinans]KAG7001091.1 Tigger transposable element-derived protein 2 [Fusarium oxysporum f. sp. conglutinans]